MHDTDHELPDLMRQATQRMQPDTADLVRRGMERGERLRRRRTAGIAAVAAAAVVLAGAGVAAVAQGLGQDRPNLQVADPPRSTPSPTPSAPSTPVMTPRDTLATLENLVPDSFDVSDRERWGSAAEGFTAASVTVDEGQGLSELSVLVEQVDPVQSCDGLPTHPVPCRELPDGSFVVEYDLASEYQDGHPSDLGVKYNAIELYRTDGVTVWLTSYTSRDEKGSPNTRPTPPFTVEQLIAMAQSPQWKAVPQPASHRDAKPSSGTSAEDKLKLAPGRREVGSGK